MVLWLTPRLLHRLVPALFKWLEKSAAMNVPRAEVLHQMVQHKAQAQLPQQAAVAVASGSESWLVTSITVSSTTEHVQLVFKGSAQQ
ncbi:MAG: hypothetical protein ACN6NT_11820, partial [Comamonas sp.]